MNILSLIRGATCWFGVALTLLFTNIASAQPENTGQSQQQLVTSSPPADQQTQEQFGLLTLTNPEGTCSASMLNDFWAITAAHCVFPQNGNCPLFAPNQISLTANWPGKARSSQVVQVVPYGFPTLLGIPPRCPNMLMSPYDVALLQTQGLGRSDAQPMKLDPRRPMNNLDLTGFGRGINALAFVAGNGTAVPTQLDGQFRSAQFAIISITPDSAELPITYTMPGNRGATLAGGDSGGPSYIQDWDDPLSVNRKLEFRLMGVHSRCQTTCLPGQSCSPPNNPWTWVSAISSCTDASIVRLHDQILQAIEAVPAGGGYVGSFPGTPPEVLSHKRALYAMSIDDPLIAPPDAAIDVQLTFKRCHGVTVVQGCPVTADLEQWGYDPASHRLYHAASGKCVNISGARHDPGSPIIIYPCQGGANEKWTLIEHAGSTIWSIKSDLTGMCLEAKPAPAGGHPPVTMQAGPATLVQMPCNGSDAQKFNSVDAAWYQRNGPH